MLANEEATGEGQADEIFFGKNHICGVCQFVMWNLRDGSFNENHFKSLIQESTTGKVKLYAIDLILANFVDQIWLFSHQFETVWGVFGWKLGLQKSQTPPAPPQRNWRRWLKRMKRDDFVGKLHKAGAVSESTAKHGAFWQFRMLVKERQSWLGISQQQKWHIQVICHMICMKWFESYRLKQSIQLSWSYKHFCKSLVLSLCRFSSPVCVTCFLEMLQRCYEGYLFSPKPSELVRA